MLTVTRPQTPVSQPRVTLANLYALFPASPLPEVQAIAGAEVPEPYRRLLVHTQHMTVTVEQFYGELVNVDVDSSTQVGSQYARKIYLRLQHSLAVVQFGIVAIYLDCLAPQVRAEILAGQTPLGRVLIQHNVMREVQSAGYFRVVLNQELAERMNVAPGTISYGRLGIITTDGHPAIRVAEILTPITSHAE
jgi:chorismate-pyruvate lyase